MPIQYDGKTKITIQSQDDFKEIEKNPEISRTVETVILGEGITFIPANTFRNWENLKSIQGINVQDVKKNAFFYCKQIEKVDLPKATEIGEHVFTKCAQLTEINLPAAIKIAGYAFSWCTKLEKIELPNATEIGEYAFSDCTNLKIITALKVTKIQHHAFLRCINLVKAKFKSTADIDPSAFENSGFVLENKHTSEPSSEETMSFNGETLDLPSFRKTINDPAKYNEVSSNIQQTSESKSGETVSFDGTTLTLSSFSDFRKIIKNYIKYEHTKKVILGKDVNIIPQNAFKKWKKLESVQGIGVQIVSEGAFSQCTQLKEINLPMVTTIEKSAFYCCMNLRKVIAPKIKIIKSYAFCACANLVELKFNSKTDIDPSAFEDSDIILDKQNKMVPRPPKIMTFDKKTLTLYSQKDFEEVRNNLNRFKNTEIVILKEGISVIPYRAFFDFKNLKTIKGVNVQTIEGYAFSDCINLTNITAPKIEKIERHAFEKCVNLVKLDFNSTVNIDSSAFKESSFMLNEKNTPIPRATQEIEEAAKAAAKAIEGPQFDGKTLTLYTQGDFEKILDTFKTAKEVILGANINIIPDHAFYGWENLESIQLNSILNIKDYAFAYCKKLTNITDITGTSLYTVNTIGKFAFYHCTSLVEISFPRVITIEESTFSDCKNLKKISALTTTKIEKHAFYGCSSLVKADFCPNINDIDPSAFDESGLMLSGGGALIPRAKQKEITKPQPAASAAAETKPATAAATKLQPAATKKLKLPKIVTPEPAKPHIPTDEHRIEALDQLIKNATHPLSSKLNNPDAIEAAAKFARTAAKLESSDSRFEDSYQLEKRADRLRKAAMAPEPQLPIVPKLEPKSAPAAAKSQPAATTEPKSTANSQQVAETKAKLNFDETSKNLTLSPSSDFQTDANKSQSATTAASSGKSQFSKQTEKPIFDEKSGRLTINSQELLNSSRWDEKIKLQTREIVCGDDVRNIPEECFMKFNALEHFVGKNVENVNNSSFCRCIKLKTVELKDGAIISQEAFFKCSSLETVIGIIKTIGDRAFSGCMSLESIDLSQVQIINTQAFEKCQLLKRLHLAAGCNVEEKAFSGCISLNDINLEVVEKIGKQAFSSCIKLDHIKLDSAKEIQEKAFEECNELSTITKIKVGCIIGERAFSGCKKLTKIAECGARIIGKRAFSKCTKLKTISGLNYVESIGDGAFSGCTKLNLDNVVLPQATSIGMKAFKNCKELTEIIAKKVRSVSALAFENCSNLKNASFAEGCKTNPTAFNGSPLKRQ